MTSARSTSTQSVSTQRVSILSVDPVGMTAIGQTRYLSQVTINLNYHAGAVHVIPAIKEQWFIKRLASDWMLERKVSFGTTVAANVVANPTSGTYQIGSSGADNGPLNLMGSQVNVQAPLGVLAVTTANRPSATTVPAGSHIFDTTISKPIWSNGANWVDSTGATV